MLLYAIPSEVMNWPFAFDATFSVNKSRFLGQRRQCSDTTSTRELPSTVVVSSMLEGLPQLSRWSGVIHTAVSVTIGNSREFLEILHLQSGLQSGISSDSAESQE